MRPLIFALSGEARSGKDSAARVISGLLASRGLRVDTYSMASPLKQALPQAAGESKEVYRPRLQELGAAWRQRFGDAVLASKAMMRAESRKDELDVLLIPDARLASEREAFMRMDNYVITIVAPASARLARMDDPHAHNADDATESEASGDPTNYRIVNDGTLDEFEAKIRAWFEAWSKGAA